MWKILKKYKIKEVGLFLTLIGIMSLSIWVMSNLYSDSNKVTHVSKKGGTIETVEDFWRASLEEDNKVNNFIIRVPNQFINPCQSITDVEFEPDSESTVIIDKEIRGDGVGQAVNHPRFIVDAQYTNLTNLSQNIHKKRYKLFNVQELRRFKNEAILKIDYGSKKYDYPTIKQLLLLYKDNNKWKIFMITNWTNLNRDNKNFAEEVNCD